MVKSSMYRKSFQISQGILRPKIHHRRFNQAKPATLKMFICNNQPNQTWMSNCSKNWATTNSFNMKLSRSIQSISKSIAGSYWKESRRWQKELWDFVTKMTMIVRVWNQSVTKKTSSQRTSEQLARVTKFTKSNCYIEQFWRTRKFSTHKTSAIKTKF